MSKLLIPQVAELTVAEKLQLIGQLWDEVLAHPDQIPVTEWQKRLLDQRHQEFLKNPDDGEPWEVVKERIRREL